jgi:hypothetical protein
MGYYKTLLADALEGDKNAMRVIARDFEYKNNLEQAIKWYEAAGDYSKARDLTSRTSHSTDHNQVTN